MDIITPFDAYRIYEAVKLHFKSDTYNYFTYNGKVKVSQTGFDSRRDKVFFQMLAKKYKHREEYVRFLVANFLAAENTWSKDLISEQSSEIYRDYQRKMQSLSYKFEQDLELLFDFCETEKIHPNELFAVKNNSAPLLKLYQQGAIILETIIILDMIFGFTNRWNKRMTDTIIWPKIERKMSKYRPFLSIDTDTYRKVIIKKMHTHT